MFRQLSGDATVQGAFEWFHPPGTVSTREDMKLPYIRWHKGLTELRKASPCCPFCHVMHSRMEGNWRYQAAVQPGDTREVWLEVPKNNPTMTVWVGDEIPEALVSGNYRFDTTPDSPIAEFFKEHAVLADSLHSVVLGQMDNWVENCNEKHVKCAHLKSRVTELPTRLVDLSPLPARKEMIGTQNKWHDLFSNRSCRLIENTPGSMGKYIALSYCWGKGLSYTTTTSNLEAHRQDGGILFARLPKTLQDALLIARFFNVDYLWADCLCIVQDDKADWEHEAARMANVYSNAFLTVSATRATHCDEGFLQPRKVDTKQKVLFEDSEGSFELYFDYDDCTMSPGSMESVIRQPLRVEREEPLLGRVWCFQERLLAARTLHFATDQMYWECSHSFEEEKGIVVSSDEVLYREYSLRVIADSLNRATETHYTKRRAAWYRMVQEYTSRNITYQTDKLPALSGVIGALQTLTGDLCYAGLWKSWFLAGLLWRVQVPEFDIYVFTHKHPKKLDFWRAPSWSFASLEGVVLYDILEQASEGDSCTFLEVCNITPSGANLLGELKSGYAKIKGPLTTITAMDQKRIGHTSNGKACTIQVAGKRYVYAGVYYDLEIYDTCDVLMITPYTGLAVRPVEGQMGTYVRVGAVVAYMQMGVIDESGSLVTPKDKDLSLSAADYPEPTSITLL